MEAKTFWIVLMCIILALIVFFTGFYAGSYTEIMKELKRQQEHTAYQQDVRSIIEQFKSSERTVY